ncbi:MAG: peptidoglycan binding domain-containing protein, partial [Anaerolineae bacterium]|nr:peptidoglycan binding domain-containing protein [Anaerolineae bacterium]
MTSHNAAPVHQYPYPPSLDDTQPVAVPEELPARSTPWLVRLLMLGLTGGVLLVILVVLFVAAHEMQYAARIYPGVAAFGVNLSGLSYDEAVRALDARFDYDDQAAFTFRDGTDTWRLTAGELGVFYDVRGTVDTAMLLGRGDALPQNLLTQVEMWFNGRTIPPVIVYDQTIAEHLLREIATQIDRPVLDATIALNGTQIVTTASQVGRTLDVPATLDELRTRILALAAGGEIPLVVQETAPAIASVAEADARLRAALSAPLVLRADAASGGEAGPWVATPDVIAAMLVVERGANADGSVGYVVRLDPEQL